MNFNVNGKDFFSEMNLEDSIQVKSNRRVYDVSYGSKTLHDLVLELFDDGDFIFIDQNVYNLSPETFKDVKNIMIFNAVEDNKNIHSALKLIDVLYNLKFNKKNKLLVIGGGITQDVGGFVAAIYKRGINWTFIPTTILSMTDSCIGSKVTINHGSKNMLGMFVAPTKIFVSDYFLKSLSADDIISGVGEAVKLSLIGGEKAYEYFLSQYAEKNYINIIKISALIKKQLIEYDEFDENERRVLNYGHSVGHAIECTTNYYIPHGIAVLIGMYIKNKLFYNDKHKDIDDLILEMVPEKFFDVDFDYEIFKTHLLSDKKNNGNSVCFILLEDIGQTKFLFKNLEEINFDLKKIIIRLFRKK